MAGAHYYRSEAERCRKRAADEPQSESTKRWLQLAAEYDQLANTLAAEEGVQPRAQARPMQQQPMQQQQSKAEEGDDT
jgi:hypothetical protein